MELSGNEIYIQDIFAGYAAKQQYIVYIICCPTPPLFLFLFMTQFIGHRRHLVIDMLACDFRSIISFPILYGPDNVLMLRQKLRVAFFLLQVLHTVPIHLFTQVVQ